MAYSKSFRTIIPLEPGGDLDLLRWLTRESFEVAAGNYGLTLVDYAEREVPWVDLPPKAAEPLPLRADDYTWYEFTGRGEVAEETIEWLTAESAWLKEMTGGK